MTTQYIEPDGIDTVGDQGHQVDEKGRRVWTDQEMRSGFLAVSRWRRRSNGDPQPTDEEFDQARALKRHRNNYYRRRADDQPAKTIDIVIAYDLTGNGLRDVLDDLQIQRDSLLTTLKRHGRRDIFERLVCRDEDRPGIKRGRNHSRKWSQV